MEIAANLRVDFQYINTEYAMVVGATSMRIENLVNTFNTFIGLGSHPLIYSCTDVYFMIQLNTSNPEWIHQYLSCSIVVSGDGATPPVSLPQQYVFLESWVVPQSTIEITNLTILKAGSFLNL
jgi:hypothetical protein